MRALIHDARRAYAAAGLGRLLGDWLTDSASIDRDIRAGMTAVRARARDLSQNSEFARAYLRALKKNIVGSEGFNLQVRAQTWDPAKNRMVPDRQANDILEQAFRRWSRPETATVSGTMSFRKLQELVVETVGRDGEMLVRIMRNDGINQYGFSLQPVEPDWLDHTLNGDGRDGNIIRMGVEIDRRRKPVAYYLSTRNETLDLFGATTPTGPHMRIPAADIIHVYDPERAEQTRGISWMAPVMVAMHNLKGFMEAAVVNARVGACKGGFFRDPSGDGGEYTGDTTEASGEKISTLEPGMFEDIGRLQFQPYEPKYPDQQFDPFVKALLRGISAGLGVSFASLSNDLTEVNFSSIRAGLIEERETWKSLQAWFIETFLNRVYAEWLQTVLLGGVVGLPITKYEKFNAPQWTGRRWQWVKPTDDVAASRDAIAAGLSSRTRILAEMGLDIEEHYQEIAAERELAAEYGLTFNDGGAEDGYQADTGDGEDDAPTEGDQPRPGGDGRGKAIGSNRVLV